MNNSIKRKNIFGEEEEEEEEDNGDVFPVAAAASAASASVANTNFTIVLNTNDIPVFNHKIKLTTDSNLVFHIRKYNLFKQITKIEIKDSNNEILYICDFTAQPIFWKLDVTQITFSFDFNNTNLNNSTVTVVLNSSKSGDIESNPFITSKYRLPPKKKGYRWTPEEKPLLEKYIPKITDIFIVDTVEDGNILKFIIDPNTHSNNINSSNYNKFGYGGKSRKKKFKNLFTKKLLKYSNPRKAQSMAYKYLGKSAKLYPARNSAKKYSIFDPKNKKWVNFGQIGYEDYTKHKDKKRRKSYLTRSRGMLGNWKKNKYSANNLSMHILW